MSKSYCNICRKYRIKYCSYPDVICTECCPKIPVETILRIMDISYHEAISYTQHVDLKKNSYEIDIKGPIFWCTMDKEGLFQRCGVDCDKDNLRIDNSTETKIVIVKPYWNDEMGIKDMKKLKQNFRRIRVGKPYYRY